MQSNTCDEEEEYVLSGQQRGVFAAERDAGSRRTEGSFGALRGESIAPTHAPRYGAEVECG